MDDLNEQSNRIKQLFSDSRLYGNLVNEQKEKEYKTKEDFKTDDEEDGISLDDKIKTGIEIYNQSETKWGDGNFRIKKNDSKTHWVSYNVKNKEDTIEIPINR